MTILINPKLDEAHKMKKEKNKFETIYLINSLKLMPAI